MTAIVYVIILIPMSKRLQVVMSDAEYREIREAAGRRRLTVSEWVRQTLRRAREAEPASDVGPKLEAVRAAVRHEYPTADVQQMLREIEAGYATEPGPGEDAGGPEGFGAS